MNGSKVRAGDQVRPANISVRFRALRAFSFPASVLPVLVATAAVRPYTEWRWDVLTACMVAVMLLHSIGNLLNDYFDFRSGVDRRRDGDEHRPGRFLVRGELMPKDILVEAGVCTAVLAPVSAYLLWKCGPAILWLGAAAIAAAYAYTGPPFAFKYRALGEPLIFLTFGPLLFLGAAYAQTGRWEWQALLISVPGGFATTSLLVGGNIRDITEDGEAGIVTMAGVLGQKAARLVYVGLVGSCVLTMSAIGCLGFGPRVLTVSPVLLVLLLKPVRRMMRGERIPDIDVQTARFEAVLLLFLLAVLVYNGGLS